MFNTSRLKRRSQDSAVEVEDLSREMYSLGNTSIQGNVLFGAKVQLVLANAEIFGFSSLFI